MEKTYKIEFTPKNIIIIFGLLVGLLVVWKLQVVIFMFFFSFILSSALRPLVEKLKRRGIPRILSILIIYSVVILCIGLIIYISGLTVADQVKTLTDNINGILTDSLIKLIDIFPWIKNLMHLDETREIRPQIEAIVRDFISSGIPNIVNFKTFSGASGTIVSAMKNVTTVVFGLFTVIMVSAYMIHKEEKFYNGVLLLFPKKQQGNIQNIIDKVESKLGGWVIGEFTLMFIVGLATYLGLAIPGVIFDGTVVSRYALPLALIAGLLEALPNFGPTVTWIIACIITIGSNGSVLEISYVAFLFFIIQQLEAIFIVPAVMKKAIGIDPIVTILGLIAATSLFGMIGAVLILPTIATAQILVDEVLIRKSENNSN